MAKAKKHSEKKPKMKIEKWPLDKSFTKYKPDLNAINMTVRESRYMVDTYYQLQETRITMQSRIRAIKLANKVIIDAVEAANGTPEEIIRMVSAKFDQDVERLTKAASYKDRVPCAITKESIIHALSEPHDMMTWMFSNAAALETQMTKALYDFSMRHEVGRWCATVKGIGPVISAGLLAMVDMDECPTDGHIWSFAGMNPNQVWLSAVEADAAVAAESGTPEEVLQKVCAKFRKKEATIRKFATLGDDGETAIEMTRKSIAKSLCRRPYSARMKNLAYKIGAGFKMANKDPESLYGQVYRKRKDLEVQRNEAGAFAEQAKAVLLKNPNHAQKAIYAKGKLSDGHIDARAIRYTAKLFLADWHHVAYCAYFGVEPPHPYPIAIMGHGHLRQTPNAHPRGLPGTPAKSVDPLLRKIMGDSSPEKA